MSDEQKPAAPPGEARAKDTREAKLAEALRANLRRRKSAAAAPSAGGPEQEGAGGDA